MILVAVSGCVGLLVALGVGAVLEVGTSLAAQGPAPRGAGPSVPGPALLLGLAVCLLASTAVVLVDDRVTLLRSRRRVELAAACGLACGVAVGHVVILQSMSPGYFVAAGDVRTVLVVLAYAICSALSVAAIEVSAARRRYVFRVALMLFGFIPAVVADPTYGIVMLALPLIDARRRPSARARAGWTVAVCVPAACLTWAAPQPRVVTTDEVMFGLAVVLLVFFLFGSALRKLDDTVTTEAELAQLKERTRITEELHDSLGHHLLACSVQIQNARALSGRDADSSQQALVLASQAAAEALAETRCIVQATRSERCLDVHDALQGLARRIVGVGVVVRVDVQGDHTMLDAVTRIAIYRVAQEALTNVVRHAGATEVRVSSTVSGRRVSVRVWDNGNGFDVAEARGASGTGGLANMRRRMQEVGGSVEFTSGRGGTSIWARTEVAR